MKRSPQGAALLIGLLCAWPTALGLAQASPDSDVTKWSSVSGEWTDPSHWSAGLPNPFKHAEVHGDSAIHVPAGTYPIANLQLGKDSDDHVRVEVDGGKLILMQDPLDLGDMAGSEGELILRDGALQDSVDAYVGGGFGAPGHSGRGSLILQGGSFLARTLILGSGWGAQSYVGVEGSRASAG